MRKITSVLLFLLLSTMSSMASTAIDFSVHTISAWSSDCTVSGTTLTFTKAYGGAGCWLADGTGSYGGVDYSNYDYLWVELNSCTCGFYLDTQYNSSKMKEDGTGYVLDESYDKKVEGKAGDIIVSAGGTSIKTMDELNKIKATKNIGDTLELEVNRNGQTFKVNIKLAEKP